MKVGNAESITEPPSTNHDIHFGQKHIPSRVANHSNGVGNLMPTSPGALPMQLITAETTLIIDTNFSPMTASKAQNDVDSELDRDSCTFAYLVHAVIASTRLSNFSWNFLKAMLLAIVLES